MKRNTRNLLLIVLACILSTACSAQWISVTANHIQNGAGGLLSSGQLCVQPVDGNNRPLIARSGGTAGGAIITSQACGTVTNGVLATGYQMPDTSMTAPANLCLRTTIRDNSQNGAAVYVSPCVQPSSTSAQSSWCTTTGGATTCNFDLYTPNVATQAVVQTGPVGPAPTIAGASAVGLTPGSTPYATVSGTNPYTFQFGIPTGGFGTVGLNGQGFQSNGVTGVPTFSAPFFTAAGNNFYGDSITHGVGPAYLSQGYAEMSEAVFGAASSNDYGTSGDMAADTARFRVFPNAGVAYSMSPNNSVMIGTNDIGVCGSSTGCMTNYHYALQAVVSDLIIPQQNKRFGQNCTTTSGTTSPDNTILGIPSLGSTTNGTVITCVTPGGGTAVDVAWRAIDGNAGVATVAIDGTTVDTLDAYGNSGVLIHTQANTNDTVYAKEYTVASATSHTVVFTVTSATGAGNLFSVVYVATPMTSWSAMAPPRLIILGIPSPNTSVTTSYNAIVQTVANQYINDGLPVLYVPTLNATTYTNDYSLTPVNISGRTLTDVAITAGSTTLTSASANFGPISVGQLLEVNGAGGSSTYNWLDTYIVSVVNQTTVTVATAATTTVTGATTYYGPAGQVCGTTYSPHPNICGHLHIRDALLAAAQPVTQQPFTLPPSPTFTGQMSGGTYAANYATYNATPIPPAYLYNDISATGTPTTWMTNYNTPIFGVNGHYNSGLIFDFRLDGAATSKVTLNWSGTFTAPAGTAAFYNFASSGVAATLGASKPIFLFSDLSATALPTTWQTNSNAPILGFNGHYNAGLIMDFRLDGAATSRFTLSWTGSIASPAGTAGFLNFASNGVTAAYNDTAPIYLFSDLNATAVPTTWQTSSIAPIIGLNIHYTSGMAIDMRRDGAASSEFTLDAVGDIVSIGTAKFTSFTASGMTTAGIVTNTAAGLFGTVPTSGTGNVILSTGTGATKTCTTYPTVVGGIVTSC